jgi:hypothetical protein
MSYFKVGDQFIDKDGNTATINSLEPFSFIVDYGAFSQELRSKDTLARFIPVTELIKALS